EGAEGGRYQIRAVRLDYLQAGRSINRAAVGRARDVEAYKIARSPAECQSGFLTRGRNRHCCWRAVRRYSSGLVVEQMDRRSQTSGVCVEGVDNERIGAGHRYRGAVDKGLARRSDERRNKRSAVRPVYGDAGALNGRSCQINAQLLAGRRR